MMYDDMGCVWRHRNPGELENGECTGKWDSGMMLVWMLCPLAGDDARLVAS
jgi:hypothetical protein